MLLVLAGGELLSMANIYKGQSHEFEELALLSDAGGMANVYLGAEVGKPDRKVAIKVPKTGLPQQ